MFSFGQAFHFSPQSELFRRMFDEAIPIAKNSIRESKKAKEQSDIIEEELESFQKTTEHEF
jgi:hypothetical protein